MADKKQPIIVKKIKKGGHGHHGGAWKIAYADFVTAMMAFFLLLWLLNAASQEQLEGIADYFAPTVTSTSQSGSGQILGGTTVAVDGSMEDTVSRPSVTMDLPPPKAGSGGEDMQDTPETTTDSAEEVQKQAEEKQFEEAKNELKEAMETLPEFQQMAESLMVDETPEGLRIQIVDQDGLAMFPSGSSNMFEHTERVLKLVSGVIMKMPQDISITGHTDAVPMGGRNAGYTNWELSADRANSARRGLLGLGVPEKRLSHIVGKAANEPLLPDDPKNARNRRLSIILLRGTGEQQPTAPQGPPPSIISGE
ncbi:MAG: flagellar motor protein MotB [Alphaproteobacteria bacterium]|nr:flagellar motor protein MotB [Alphaproteobacteria bacterium]MBF0249030.1 flagellar motor protein MotB [Alphaproteobacteria bacterium]